MILPIIPKDTFETAVYGGSIGPPRVLSGSPLVDLPVTSAPDWRRGGGRLCNLLCAFYTQGVCSGETF